MAARGAQSRDMLQIPPCTADSFSTSLLHTTTQTHQAPRRPTFIPTITPRLSSPDLGCREDRTLVETLVTCP